MKANLNCFDVANYFLILLDKEAGDVITQLKLHKLLYFAQGFSLSILNKPLFKEEIEAWKHGPVVRELRKTFGDLKDGNIPTPGEMDFEIYSQQDKELIYKVHSVYGEHSASYLRNLTHKHVIWEKAYNNIEDNIITKDAIKRYFLSIYKDRFSIHLSEEDKLAIINAEDEWWMNYDSGIPSTDETLNILKSINDLKSK